MTAPPTWSTTGTPATTPNCAATPGPWPSLNNVDIALGRGFTPTDEDKGTHNAIVGYDIVDNLLGDGDPIGKEIRVDGIPYTIVGVGDRQGKTLGESQDNWVAVPITTYQQTYGYNDSVDIYARANGNAEVMERAKDEVRVLMRSRRHDAPGAPDDFEMETNDTFLDIWKQISALFTWVVLGIASISLVVGGIVIMNIMLVSRHRAHPRDRRAQGAGRAAARRAAAVPHRKRHHGSGGRSHRRARRRRSSAKLITLSSAFPPACSCGASCWAFRGRRRGHLLRRLPGQQSRPAGPGGGAQSGDVGMAASG